MVLAEIATGLASLKTALEILKGLRRSNTASSILTEIAELQSALIDVQNGIIAANQTHSADVETINDLKKEIARLTEWDGEKERYQLKQVGPGGFAYALRPGASNNEPAHWLCANCYHNKKKVLLQYYGHSGHPIYSCPSCNAQIFSNTREPTWG